MNLRLAKKITQCKSNLFMDYDKVMEAREIMQKSNIKGWLFYEFSREDHARMLMELS